MYPNLLIWHLNPTNRSSIEQSWKSQFFTHFGGRENLEKDLSNLCPNLDVRKKFCLIFLRLWKCIKLFRAVQRSSKTKSCRALSSFSHLPLTQRLWCTFLISKSWGRLRKPKMSSKSSNLDGFWYLASLCPGSLCVHCHPVQIFRWLGALMNWPNFKLISDRSWVQK